MVYTILEFTLSFFFSQQTVSVDLSASVAQIVRSLVVHAVVEVCATVEVTASVLTVNAKRESV